MWIENIVVPLDEDVVSLRHLRGRDVWDIGAGYQSSGLWGGKPVAADRDVSFGGL